MFSITIGRDDVDIGVQIIIGRDDVLTFFYKVDQLFPKTPGPRIWKHHRCWYKCCWDQILIRYWRLLRGKLLVFSLELFCSGQCWCWCLTESIVGGSDKEEQWHWVRLDLGKRSSQQKDSLSHMMTVFVFLWTLYFVFCKDSTRIMYHCICILAPDLSQQKDRLSHMHLSIFVFVFESYGDSIELIQVVIVQEKWSISSG